MRFFKYGKILAVTLPESLRAAAGVKEGDDYEFAQIEPGVFLLISRKVVEEKVVKSALAQALSKLAKPPEKQTAPAEAPWEATRAAASPARRMLEQRGYYIAAGEEEAKGLSRELDFEVRSGAVKGTRGFDKKFYIVTTEFFSKLAPKIARALEGKKAASLSEVADATKTEPAAVLACLQVMKEMGDVLEKRREIFALAK